MWLPLFVLEHGGTYCIGGGSAIKQRAETLNRTEVHCYPLIGSPKIVWIESMILGGQAIDICYRPRLRGDTLLHIAINGSLIGTYIATIDPHFEWVQMDGEQAKREIQAEILYILSQVLRHLEK